MPRAKKVETTVIPEGETAMSAALREAFARFGQSFSVTPAIVKVLDQALEFRARRDDVIKAIAKHGPENLFAVLGELAAKDEVTAMQAIKNIMAQLTGDVHFRWRSVYRQQMLAARSNGGGVNGFELSISEIMEKFGSYPGTPDDACTPAEQSEIVQDLHALLHSAYQACDRARMYWLDDYQPQDLPYVTYQDENDEWINVNSFDEALSFLDRRAEQRVEQRKSKAADAIKAISNLSLAAA